jgi:DNA polymerase-3 subunit gamma/tau
MDLIEIDAASNRGIDDMRELKSKVMISTGQGKYKIYIIDEVHMLSKEAFNALLKTLEEPPSNVVFILATTEPYSVPETIISRCQRFDFKPLSAAELMQLLNRVVKKEAMKIDKEILQLIAVYAAGSSRDALSFLEQINSLQKPITLEKAKHVLGVLDLGGIMRIFDALVARESKVLELVKEELAKGYSVQNLINGMLKYLEDLIFVKNIGEPVSPTALEIKNKMQKQAGQISNADLAQIFNLLIEARYLARDLDVENLPLEIVLLKYLAVEPDLNKPVQKTVVETEPVKEETLAVAVEPIKKVIEPALESKIESVVSVAANADLKMDEAEFEKGWQQVVQELKKFNHSISTFLNKASVHLSSDKILVEVPFGLYQKILTQPKNNQKIHSVVHSIFHKPLGLEIVLKDSQGAEEIKKAFGI